MIFIVAILVSSVVHETRTREKTRYALEHNYPVDMQAIERCGVQVRTELYALIQVYELKKQNK